MQTIFVKCKSRANTGAARLKNSLNLRKKGGAYYRALKNSLKNFSDKKSGKNFYDLSENTIMYFFGSKAALRRLSKHIERETPCASPPDTLYHFLPIEYTKTVKKHGLKSKNGLIYLTDSVQYIVDEGYLQCKTDLRQKDTEYCILEIDAARLKNIKTIYHAENSCEYIVKSVPPQYINFG